MKTIQEVVRKTVQKTPFIEEAIHEKLINASSLARMILPQVEKVVQKKVKIGAVIMAINRLSPETDLKIRKRIKQITLNLGDYIVRSNLCDFTFKNSPTLLLKLSKIMQKIATNRDYFFTVSQGIAETNIITSKSLHHLVEEILENEALLNSMQNLASITLKLTNKNQEQSGVYYFILKQLAWANISMQEIISTTNEMTIVVKEQDINETFAILMNLKQA